MYNTYNQHNGVIIIPAVYNLRYDKINNEFYIEYYIDRFEISDKLFGGIDEKNEYFYNSYTKHDKSTNILLTGVLGSGKTTQAESLANLCLSKGMPVIRIMESFKDADANIVDFLDRLANTVIMIDEFGKKFTNELQDKLIETVSSSHFGKKMFILLDNDKSNINRFFINRPGRIRYHIDFTRIKRKMIEDYCDYYQVDTEFKNELLALYNTTSIFTTDHLKALVSEHEFSPTTPMRDLLEILNIETGINDLVLVITKATIKDSDKEENYAAVTSETYNNFLYNNYWLYPSSYISGINTYFSSKNIVAIDEATKTLTLNKDGNELVVVGMTQDQIRALPKIENNKKIGYKQHEEL